jgi:hypothetical protein
VPDQAGTVERLAVELAHLLARIAGRLSDGQVLDTFEQLGVRFPAQFVTDPAISAARSTIVTVTAELDGLVSDLTDAIEQQDVASMVAAGLALLTQCGRVTAAFPELANAIQAAGPALPGVTQAQITALVAGLPGKLGHLLLADLLELSPPVAAVLTVIGVLERTYDSGDPADPTRPPFEHVTVHLDRLVPALTDPAGHLAALYGWGGAAFDAAALLTVLDAVVARLGLPVLLVPATAAGPARLQVFAFDLHATGDGTGLALEVMLPASLDTSFSFGVAPPAWTAQVGVHGQLHTGTGGELRPPFKLTLTPPSGQLTGALTVGLHAQPADPFVVLGVAGGSRLEFAGLSLDGGVTLTFDAATGSATGAPVADGEISGGKLVIDTSSGDGFLSTVLGGGRLESEFAVGFSFAPDTGLRFHGSGGIEISVPVHASLGPIEIQAVYLLAKITGPAVPVELSAAFAASLGPIRASVDRLGIVATLGFPAGGGNLGPAELDFAFKPPNGVGLAVDAGVVKGGGYLYFDPGQGEYAGALELEFADFLAVKAIGLITTRMPDGSNGFSLLLVLTAEFGGGGLQLGYGFRLLAVGGLIGLNRTMNLAPLMEGVRTGAIESIMFPTDVVANAPRILSDLRAFFPPQSGTFLIGPMAKIGWGTPTLISISVGVVIEIPGNVAIVGVVRVALPTDEAAILVLQVNFAGAIEFDKQRLYFFASLFDSRVLILTIEGELGLLVAWGNDPNLVLTVGGFHPAFKPPPLPFPSPRRITINILNTAAARIRVSGYFAVTSNTAQFGAAAELYFGFSVISIEGHIGFDALFQFSPFAFVIEISASVSLKVFGIGLFAISLRFALSGPTPWRARGTGSISLLFFEVSADFDITWGVARDTTLPPVDVLPLLAAELGKPEGWQTVPPAGGKPLVSLRPLAQADGDLVLHPLGTLFVRQRAVPLDIKLDKVGSRPVGDATRCSLTVEAGALVKRSDADEMFALAQFQDLDDAAKLSRPAFEHEHGGVELAVDGAALASQRAVRRSARYEQIVIDPVMRKVSRFTVYIAALFSHFLGGNAVSRSPLSQAERTLRQPFEETIGVSGDSFAVASTRDNTTAAPVFSSEAQAQAHLADLVAADPGLTGSLHVIPDTELSGARTVR